MKRIAYLAPEIPALSATFVYNEIIEMENEGLIITPISVHIPSSPACDATLRHLTDSTNYLYQKSILKFILTFIKFLLKRPKKILAALQLLFKDLQGNKLPLKRKIGLIYRFLASCTAAEILLSQKCEHIHAHFAHVPTDIAMYAAEVAGVTYSFTSHANDIFVHNWLLKEKIDRSKFAVTISEFNRNFIAKHCDNHKKIHVIPCGISGLRFNTQTNKILNSPFTIGILGRMVEKKGFDIALEAAKILVETGMKFSLLLAGDGPLKEALHRKVLEQDLSNQVKFLGPVPHEDVPNWLKTIDVFVLPCQMDSKGDMDGIPVVLMEAMAAGVPVISTWLSGIPELINNYNEGILIPPREPKALASSITKMLSETDFRNRCIINAADKVNHLFNININTRVLAKLFDTTTPPN